MRIVIKETTRLPCNLFHKNYSETCLTDVKLAMKDLKQILSSLPEGEWVLVKKYGR